jgi:DNA-binding GntR family transcriptional regulator
MNQSFDSNDEKIIFSEKPVSLKDWAYEQIKHWILNLELQPGSPLILNDIANRMKISSTPVREALHRLEAEGLVQIRPRLGFFVSEITPDDLRNLFELRILIEGFAAEKVAPQLKTEALDELGKLVDQCSPSRDDEFSKQFLIADQKFHSFITESTHNPKLNQIMDMLHNLTQRGVALGATSFNNVQQSYAEHLRILSALRERNSEEAGRQMRTHLTSVMDRLLEMLNTPELSGKSPFDDFNYKYKKSLLP